jgi:hypothetical protein
MSTPRNSNANRRCRHLGDQLDQSPIEGGSRTRQIPVLKSPAFETAATILVPFRRRVLSVRIWTAPGRWRTGSGYKMRTVPSAFARCAASRGESIFGQYADSVRCFRQAAYRPSSERAARNGVDSGR